MLKKEYRSPEQIIKIWMEQFDSQHRFEYSEFADWARSLHIESVELYMMFPNQMIDVVNYAIKIHNDDVTNALDLNPLDKFAMKMKHIIKHKILNISNNPIFWRSLIMYMIKSPVKATNIAYDDIKLLLSNCGDKSSGFQSYSKPTIIFGIYICIFTNWLRYNDANRSIELSSKLIDGANKIGSLKTKMKSIFSSKRR